jgi:DNA-binding MarR family transcriptional regulator
MSGDAALDRVLQLFERGQHSATEMRVLLRLLEHRDASIAELAEQLDSRPTEVTRAGRRLAMRGLVRTHHAGTPEQTLMEITRSGRAAMRSLLTAAGSYAASQEKSALRQSPNGH